MCGAAGMTLSKVPRPSTFEFGYECWCGGFLHATERDEVTGFPVAWRCDGGWGAQHRIHRWRKDEADNWQEVPNG